MRVESPFRSLIMKKKSVSCVLCFLTLFFLTTGGIQHFRSDVYGFANSSLSDGAELYFDFGQEYSFQGVPFVYMSRRLHNVDKAEITFIEFRRNRYRRVAIESVVIVNTNLQRFSLISAPIEGDLAADGNGLVRSNQSDLNNKVPLTFSISIPHKLDQHGRVTRVEVAGWAEDKAGIRQPFFASFLATYDCSSSYTFTWCLVGAY